MTALQQTQRQGLPRWLWPLLLLIVLAGPALAVMDTPNGRVMTTSHAVERHGDEATSIRQCLQQNGAMQTWANDDDPCILYFVTLLKCGRLGVLIAQVWPSLVDGCDFRERSAYVPRDGSPGKVFDYLSRFASPID